MTFNLLDHYFKIYRYINLEHLPISRAEHPGHIIFPEQLNRNLPRRADIIFGERRRSVYYASVEDGEYIEPIIKIDYAFRRDEIGLLYEKLRTISWMLESDKWSHEVQTDVIPVLSDAEKLLEIKRRRYNVVTELKGLAKRFSTKEFNLEGKTLEIFEKYQLLVNSYVDAGSALLRDAISSYDADWLDKVNPTTGNTPREVFYKYFSIGVLS